MTDRPTRRQYLLATGVFGATGLAGCVGSDGGSEPTDSEGDGREGAPTVTPTATLTPSEPPDDSGGSPFDETEQADVSTRAQTSEFTADDVGATDAFGATIAVSGDGSTAVVGAPTDGEGELDAVGSAYVFARDGDGWTQQTRLRPENTEDIEGFGGGLSVSRDGSTVLASTDRKTAHVFARSDGAWTETAVLRPDGSIVEIRNAVSLSADGETALVGSPGSFSGDVYEFGRSNGEWTQRNRFEPADLEEGDAFGAALALSDDGTTALVGAPENGTLDAKEKGSAYLFTRADDGWTEETRLVHSGREENDEFGATVALDAGGTTALVGSTGGGRLSSGAAHVFTNDGGNWVEAAELTAPGDNTSGPLGEAVTLSDDGQKALLGAQGYESRGTESAGAAYLFSRAGGQWELAAELAATGAPAGAAVGDGVALVPETGTALVGASGQVPFTGINVRGTTYVFDV